MSIKQPLRSAMRMLSMRRILWLVSLSALLSITATWGLLLWTVNQRLSGVLTSYFKHGSPPPKTASCHQAPQKWGMRLENGARVYAYDVTTFRSANPKAPPFPRQLQGAVRRNKQRIHTRWPLFSGGSTHAIKVAAKGPCSLIAVRWMISPHQRLVGLLRLSVVFFSGLLLCFVLGFLWIARPLLLRIQELAGLAEQTGQDEVALAWSKTREDDDLGHIAQSLQLAHQRILDDRRALAAQHEALREHVANLAHDLRTPIASLQLVLERASQRRGGHPQEEIAAALADAVYLEQLTDNLNLATRLEEALWEPSSLDSVELCTLIQRVASRFQVLADEQGIELAHAYPDGELHCMGDAILLERALSNLLYNALRYNQRGGHVALLLESRGGEFVCQVMDDGPGVPPTEIPKLSLRHYRSDEARQRDTNGQGLGLAITAEVCQRLNYTLAFTSIDPKGLCATIRGSLL